MQALLQILTVCMVWCWGFFIISASGWQHFLSCRKKKCDFALLLFSQLPKFCSGIFKRIIVENPRLHWLWAWLSGGGESRSLCMRSTWCKGTACEIIAGWWCTGREVAHINIMWWKIEPQKITLSAQDPIRNYIW